MESRFDWFRNALGVILGLVVGFMVLSPVAVKAISMLPVISILTPAQNQDVSGQVTFYATADSEGVASLQFQVDGQDFGSPIAAGSCRAMWNSTEAVDGLHTVQAVGRDEFNNPISSAVVTVRVNNFVPTPTPTPTPTPPPVAPPSAPPAPPSNPSPAPTVTILSPSPNAIMKGVVPVFVAIPAQTGQVLVHLRNAWGETVSKWQLQVTPSASTTTVQVNAEIGNLPNASYALIAMASVGSAVVTSEPVPVRVENSTVTPTPAPPQTPAQSPATRTPSRIKSPTDEGVAPSLATGAARPRPGAQPTAGERASARSSSSTSSTAKAVSKSLFGSGSKTQKSTAPATAKGTSLPAGTVVSIGLGPCKGPDPYAKHATLKGECVSGTWFPRVRKAEPKR